MMKRKRLSNKSGEIPYPSFNKPIQCSATNKQARLSDNCSNTAHILAEIQQYNILLFSF